MKNLDVIIETPKGCNEKFKYEPSHGLFKLNKALPAGMSFPYDFGFIPRTKGEDGDPLDCLVLSEFKTYPGCILECRLIGAVVAEQTSKKEKVRNDRFFMVPVLSREFEKTKTMEDLSKDLLKQIEDFFINYNKIEEKEFKIIELLKPKEAMQLIKASKK
jgi:inorganic pyrophosphatase